MVRAFTAFISIFDDSLDEAVAFHRACDVASTGHRKMSFAISTGWVLVGISWVYACVMVTSDSAARSRDSHFGFCSARMSLAVVARVCHFHSVADVLVLHRGERTHTKTLNVVHVVHLAQVDALFLQDVQVVQHVHV
jgi:hypothetical protein